MYKIVMNRFIVKGMRDKSFLLPMMATLLVSLFASCGGQSNSDIEIISVDINSEKVIDISEGKLIELETTDQSLLYDIGQIEFINDKMFILSRESVHAFSKEGKFLFNVGAKGNGPGEYTSLANMFVQNEHVYLFDSMSRKVLCFNENGEFVSSTSIDLEERYPVSRIYRLNSGQFIGRNMFRGDHEIVPLASLLDENYQFVYTIEGKHILSGLTSHDNFFEYQDEILYWETLNDTIFSIVNQTVKPKYFVDFGAQAIPEYVRGKDVYEIIEFVNKPENVYKTAILVGFVNEDEASVRFRFCYGQQVYYTYYDKANHDVNVYRLEDKNKRFRTSIYVCSHSDGLYVSALWEGDSEKNPCLFVLDESVLWGN
jgi:hypothetical protein